ncbi:MAG: NAD(P)/FAD-dependent oxidoreductase [Reichenbachiella sp.]|uniref:NAD(P)/FAD-dependent oxidoreductase n=1 Tax=Reichenbachiella sp. TaxID=2184521 RepID=UPI00296620EB|nr:NAD(P)/FAD-dependent oxidoreductase [Reichenbachiella sp.]MDW3208556.1 NAD(P)/FAD-dependent oxidoreductase [Reichenbachiella sp.]
MYDVIIVGGGLAGLVNAILLARSGFEVALFEKNSYPFHRVCGEYISNEVKPFLIRNGLFPTDLNPTEISKFKLTSTNGKQAELALEMGGFGVSRFAFDYFLFQQAQAAGATILQNHKVKDIKFVDNEFQISANRQDYRSKLVIGAYGKRSALDKSRKFMNKKSPYLGVKYHIKIDLPTEEIALHNFQNGYCGISQVENNTFNLCYLSHRNNLKNKSIDEMETTVLHKNQFLKSIWDNADFVFEKPKVINEISFEKKELVYDHILMCGDTAGMITPLCGNGMAMAIRSAKLLSDVILEEWNGGNFKRFQIEENYRMHWHQNFSSRLWTGRQIQKMFGSKWSSNLAVRLVNNEWLGNWVVSQTHGTEF